MAYKYSDGSLKEDARAKLREMLSRKSFAERWEPVFRELKWVSLGRQGQDQHQKILPEYCYNILELYRRTLFRVLPTLAETVTISNKESLATCKTLPEAKQQVRIDWEKFGALVGVGVRAWRFYDYELGAKLGESGLLDLTEVEGQELMKLLAGEDWLEKKSAELQAQEPGKSIQEIIDHRVTGLETTIKAGVQKWNDVAYQWDSNAIGKLNRGVAKGASEFLDDQGNLKGEKKLELKETYDLLLLVWPEIEEMMKASPPKTRNDLWEWLAPFSYAGWIEIQDLEQLNRLCAAIKLRLKKPGAPRKPRTKR